MTNDNDSSTTRSGVGAGQLVIRDDAAQLAATGKGAAQTLADTNREVETGKDTSGKIANNFNQQEVETTLATVAAFTSAAAGAIGDYAAGKLKEADDLKLAAASETDPAKKAELIQRSSDLESNWKEDGAARVALHTVVGGLGGGVGGALGAGATSLATPAIAEQINKLDVPAELKSALTLAAGTAVGAAVGGGEGAAAASNEVVNNYLNHKRTGFRTPSEQAQFDAAVAACNAGNSSACTTRDKLISLSQSRDNIITAACSGGPSKDCGDVVRLAQDAGNKVYLGNDGKAYVYPVDTPEARVLPGIGEGSFHVELSKSVLDGLLMEGGNGVANAVLGLGGKALSFLKNGFGGIFKVVDEGGSLMLGENAVIPKVTAEGSVGGQVFTDVNQTARIGANSDQATLIADRIAAKEAANGKNLPNGNMATAHAEVGTIQQAFDAGVTKGADMSLTVTGEPVCGYCVGDVAAMANKSGLKSLTVFEKMTGRTLYWEQGMKSLKVR